MRGLFALADEYMRQSDWRDMALIKFCLCATGVLLGLSIPKKSRRMVGVVAMLVFIVTYIPLMIKLFCVAKGDFAQEIEVE